MPPTDMIRRDVFGLDVIRLAPGVVIGRTPTSLPEDFRIAEQPLVSSADEETNPHAEVSTDADRSHPTRANSSSSVNTEVTTVRAPTAPSPVEQAQVRFRRRSARYQQLLARLRRVDAKVEKLTREHRREHTRFNSLRQRWVAHPESMATSLEEVWEEYASRIAQGESIDEALSARTALHFSMAPAPPDLARHAALLQMRIVDREGETSVLDLLAVPPVIPGDDASVDVRLQYISRLMRLIRIWKEARLRMLWRAYLALRRKHVFRKETVAKIERSRAALRQAQRDVARETDADMDRRYVADTVSEDDVAEGTSNDSSAEV
ncbi:hypothetical protein MMC13_006818 [Lambiella insularis]|nr:hypothetical protein [Lambiella insularis]